MSKIRLGFVSNSSSSSFIIKKQGLTAKQIESLVCFQHMIVDEVPEDWEDADSWEVREHGDYLFFDTCMDNFNLVGFLQAKGFILQDIERD